MGLLNGLATAGKLILGLFALVEIVGVVVFGASVIAYQNDPQNLYILTGSIGLLVAVLAEVG